MYIHGMSSTHPALVKMKALLVLVSALLAACWAENLSLVLLKDAPNTGAMCLDGSPPGYYIRKGVDSGADKWILHQQGGGWCMTAEDCYNRSMTDLGSSTKWPQTITLGGFLSDKQKVNPDFYNWNMVYLMYCDGASFAGYVDGPVHYNNTPIYYRGRPILQALLDDLLAKGMKSASEVILTGCSAGGLATYLHADYVKAYLPNTIKFRAMADAGFFLDIPNIEGVRIFRDGSYNLFSLQNVSGGLDQDCLRSYKDTEPWRCMFAPYSYPYIQTPMFVLNSDYDTAQLEGILQLGCRPPNCSDYQMMFFEKFRTQFLSQLKVVVGTLSSGMFIDSCLVHCQTLTDNTWAGFHIGNHSMSETFADWYFDRVGETKLVDCDYPCNPTCTGYIPPVPEI